jgi:hypothetical protein
MPEQKTHTFTDALDRTWDLTLSIATARRLKDRLDVDLLAVLDSDVLMRLAMDIELFVNTLYVICAPQCEQRDVSDEQFGEGLGGDTLDAAAFAFNRALVDFFPSRRRAILQKVNETIEDFQTRAAALAIGKLEGPELKKRIEEGIRQTDRAIDELIKSGSASGTAPAPSAATPDP